MTTSIRTLNPVLTADAVVLTTDKERGDQDSTWYVLLITRANAPHAGSLALPGGKHEPGETLRQTALRELAEETGLDLDTEGGPAFGYRTLLIRDALDRDPRGHYITAPVGFVLHSGGRPEVKAQDDAAAVGWYDLQAVLAGKHAVAFDHAEIIRDAWYTLLFG